MKLSDALIELVAYTCMAMTAIGVGGTILGILWLVIS
jgi:hypothetical protein